MDQPIADRFTALSLYEALPGLVRPPPVIELADGVHDFEALVAAIPEEFAGVLDFLTCSGMWFAKALRRRRARPEAFMGFHQLAWFLERLILYKATIGQIALTPMAYREAAVEAEREAMRWLINRGRGPSQPKEHQ
jgi:hypothetical protein